MRDDLIRRNAEVVHQIVVGGLNVLIGVGFGGSSAAGSETLIVVSEDGKPQTLQLLQGRTQESDVFGISVTVEEGVGGFGIRKIAGRNLDTVPGGEFEDLRCVAI